MIQKIMNWIRMYWFDLKYRVQQYPVHSNEVKKILEEESKGYIECVDSKYYTCDYATAKLIASLIPTKFLKYKSEVNDCDDFARGFYYISRALFPTLPVGYCHVKTSRGKHALNFIIYKTAAGRFDFTFIEPQTGLLRYFNYKMYLAIV